MTFTKWLLSEDAPRYDAASYLADMAMMVADWPHQARSLKTLKRYLKGDQYAVDAIDHLWDHYRCYHHPISDEEHRGHTVHYDSGHYFDCRTGRRIDDPYKLPCTACGLPPTPEGHDGCLGDIPGAESACCGHGQRFGCYVGFALFQPHRLVIRHEAAMAIFEGLGKQPAPFGSAEPHQCEKWSER